jgi:hypothetical protein
MLALLLEKKKAACHHVTRNLKEIKTRAYFANI